MVLHRAVQAFSGVVAPILGGALYGALGIRFIVIITYIAFFITAVMEIFIKIPFAKRERNEHIVSAIAKDMKEGFVYVLEQTFIFKCLLVLSLCDDYLRLNQLANRIVGD